MLQTSWHEFPSNAEYIQALVKDIANTLDQAVAEHGRAGLAVSGGRSPIPLFDALSQADLPWDAVHITLVDDRFVPPSHSDSNERLVRTHLLRNKAAAAHFTGLVTHPDNITACISQANQIKDVITVAILGMGDDGHTASLFPGTLQLTEGLAPDTTDRYLHITPLQAQHERISMTLTAILSVERLILAISGGDKRHVLSRAAQGSNPALPISYVVNQTGVPLDVYWHA